MRTRHVSCVLISLSGLLISSLCLAQSEPDAAAPAGWRTEMHSGRYLAGKGRCEETLIKYQRALALAPSDEYAADTLRYTASSYEALRKRAEAVATWKRIVDDYPDSRRHPYACHRLGDLNSSVTIVPDEELEPGEMSAETAIHYYEKNIAENPPLNPFVLGSKCHLACAYLGVGKEEEVRALLEKLALLDVSQVDEPWYLGPSAGGATLSERIDKSRRRAALIRDSSVRMIVHCSKMPGRPAESIANLQALVEKYPDTDIARLAQDEMDAISKALAEEAAKTDLTDLVNIVDPEEVVVEPSTEVSAAGLASETIEDEVTALLEAAKSKDAEVRAAAVRELVAMRASVADLLVSVMNDADNDKAPVVAKIRAIFLVGEFGFVQCTDRLETQRGWKADHRKLYEQSPKALGPALTGRLEIINPATKALNRISAGGNAVPCDPGVRSNLSRHPALQAALIELRSPDYETNSQGYFALFGWYNSIYRGISSVLNPVNDGVYDDDVRVTFAYLSGEYRCFNGSYLCGRISLKDTKGLLADYPASMVVTTDEPDYPCVVALLKTGRRSDIRSAIIQAMRRNCPSEDRGRIARTIMAIQPERVRAEVAKKYLDFQADPGNKRDPEGFLERLNELNALVGGDS